MHAEGKPIPHGGGQGYAEEALLHQTAERTVGYSGAELAGLLNEASILAVRLAPPDYRTHMHSRMWASCKWQAQTAKRMFVP